MPSLSEQLLALVARANGDPDLRVRLLRSPADVLSESGVALGAGVTATAEYHDGYGLHVELHGLPAGPSGSREALEDPLLDCLHH